MCRTFYIDSQTLREKFNVDLDNLYLIYYFCNVTYGSAEFNLRQTLKNPKLTRKEYKQSLSKVYEAILFAVSIRKIDSEQDYADAENEYNFLITLSNPFYFYYFKMSHCLIKKKLSLRA